MLTAGNVLQNRYRIVSLLGQGGMGAVYRAWHLHFDIPVALKEMTPQSGLDPRVLAELRRQFQQEAAVLARLNHSSLVRVTDFFEEGGNTYLVMDFVEGESLADRIGREGALPEPQVLTWAGQLLDALAYCHAQGVLHRDVKPQNVVITPEGKAVLVDFGLVKLWDPNDPRTRTAMRGMGTPEYAPPEQYGVRPGHTGPRSDLYSLGATLYHALAGQAPPTATDRMADPELFVPLQDLNLRVSRETEAAVLRAMELARSQRWQSAQEIAAALGGGAVAPAPPAPPKRKPTKVMPGAVPSPSPGIGRGGQGVRAVPVWAWALGGLALVALVVGVLLLGGGEARPTPEVPEPTGPPTETPPLTRAPAIHDTSTRPADGMVMVYVPAGEFEMGSDDDGMDYALQLCNEYYGDCERAWFEDEQPVHPVTLDGFWIDQTEVTNGQFAAFLNEQGNQVEGGGAWLELENDDCLIEQVGDEYQPRSGYADHPVVEVSWYGAMAYCEWAGGRLPTEAEWKYAARGVRGSVYPWGDEFDGTRLNYCDANCELDWVDEASDDGYAYTAPVGSYLSGASWCDALDMAGNVWEWVADWYVDYPSGAQANPTVPSSGEGKLLRGGSWGGVRISARCASRNRYPPVNWDDYVGFRCARVSHE